jgi:hypothetical protein
MNPSISTPSQNEILPLLRLDGTPQTLEGTPELAEGEQAVYAGSELDLPLLCAPERASLLDVCYPLRTAESHKS